MKIKLCFLFVALFFLFCVAPVKLLAADFVDGRVKLTLNERTGRFQIFCLADRSKVKWQSLLWSRDPKTSYLAVQLDKRIFKLGDVSYFRTAVRGSQTNPNITFESPSLSVVMEFSFIKTPNSDETNGVRIDIRMQNWSEKEVEAGLKLVLDSYIGEKKSPQFRTNLRYIDSETIINRVVNDQWWLAKDKNASLMGSVFVEGTFYPDTLHFANWKRLTDAKWKLPYVAGRNFNALPFSVRDCAVTYFLETTTLARWDQRTMTVMLATEDPDGFATPTIPVSDPFGYAPGTAPQNPQALLGGAAAAASSSGGGTSGGGATGESIITPSITQNITINQPDPPAAPRQAALVNIGELRADLITLRQLIYKIDEYVYFRTQLTELELSSYEAVVARLRSRYGAVWGGLR